MKLLLILIIFALIFPLRAQDRALPYSEIPSYPETFTAGAVASRMIDGLGFRYYWATEGLRAEDLAHKPSKDARTSEETITHIFELSQIIANSVTNTPNLPELTKQKYSFDEMRKQTLSNFKIASDKLRLSTDQQMSEYKLTFKRATGITEFPFWNQLNGPIADCLWHVGQVVTFRRSSGNPFNEKASVFTGTVRK
jgi:hypothetical protein